MIEGHFIAIEGIDGAGSTTHTKLASKSLKARGLPVHTTREPSDGPIGTMLRQVLKGRLVVPSIGGGRPLGWKTMALLFAADRLDHLEAEVHPNLRDGVTVFTDRYDYSSVAYQTITGGDTAEVTEWVKTLNKHAQRPDLTIVLDVDPEIAASRRLSRPGGAEIYDASELQVALAAFYRDIDKHFPNDNIVHIDGSGAIETTAAAIEAEIRKVRNEAT